MAADATIGNKLVQNRVIIQEFLSQQVEVWRKRHPARMYERRVEVLGMLIAGLIDRVRNEWEVRMSCDETPFPCFKLAFEQHWNATRQYEAHFHTWVHATAIAELPKIPALAREEVEYKKAAVDYIRYRQIAPISEFLISGNAIAVHRHYLVALMDYTNLVAVMYFLAVAVPKEPGARAPGALKALDDEIYSKWLYLRHGKRTKEDALRAIDDVQVFIKRLRELV